MDLFSSTSLSGSTSSLLVSTFFRLTRPELGISSTLSHSGHTVCPNTNDPHTIRCRIACRLQKCITSYAHLEYFRKNSQIGVKKSLYFARQPKPAFFDTNPAVFPKICIEWHAGHWRLHDLKFFEMYGAACHN